MKKREIKIFLTVLVLLFYSSFALSEYYSGDDGYVSNYDYPDEGVDNSPAQDVSVQDAYDGVNTEYNNTFAESSRTNKNVNLSDDDSQYIDSNDNNPVKKSAYFSRLPQAIRSYGEKVIIVNPKIHTWGAYTPEGKLIRAGLASAGAKWCPDIHRPCRTKVGVFRIYSLGSANCVSTRYPVGKGGAPMPYCMYFNKNQGLHGSHELAEGNISHGCVRMNVNDAKWIRYNFANIGTKVIILSY